MNKVHINDLFMWCNDIKEMQEFYTKILSLEEAWVQFDKNETGNQYLGYKLANNQTLHFIKRNNSFQIQKNWSYQPSSEITDGIEKPSWTMEMSRGKLEEIVKTLKDKGIDTFQNEIQDRGAYSAITVMDPMGMTIDLYYLHDSN